MRLSGIKLINFASHENTELEFAEKDRLVLIRGLNGSGKSYLMDAVSWALYGTVDRGVGLKARQLIREGAKESTVSAVIDGESQIRVDRHIKGKSSSVKMFVDGHPNSGRTSSMTQKKIEGVLGFPHRSFMSACYLSQGMVGAFTGGKSSDRVRILSDVLRLDDIDNAIQIAKNDLRLISDRNERNAARLGFVQEALEDIGSEDDIVEDIQLEKDQKRLDERELGSLRKKREAISVRAKLQADYRANLKSLEDSLSFNEETLASLNADVDADKDRRDQVKSKIDALEKDMGKVEVLRKALKDNPYPREEENEVRDKLAECSATIKSLTNRISDLEELLEYGGVCPTCGRSVDSGHNDIKDVIKEMKDEKKSEVKYHQDLKKRMKQVHRKIAVHEEAKSAFENASRAKESLDIVQDQLDAYNKRLSDRRREITAREKSARKIKKDIEKLGEKYKGESRKLGDQEDLETVDGKIDKLLSKVGSSAERIKSLQDNLERSKELKEEVNTLAKSVSKSKGKMDINQYWIYRFPKVKLALIDRFIPQMEDIANSILSYFSPIRVEFSTMVEKQSGGSMDKFNIVVYEGKQVRDWENWSGGEKKQIAVAICLAMNTALWNMGFGLNFILMDEVFSDLDVQKRPNVLKYLVDSGRNVMVISHTDINPAFFNRNIIVKKVNGASKVSG